MKRNLLLAAALLASAASITSAQAAPERLSYRTFHYVCDGGQRVSAAYVRFGDADFVRLNYAGRQYALAPATSASGERYASLTGPVTKNSVGNGLEWWVAKGEGMLSTFTGTDTAQTKTLLTGCKIRR